KLAGPEEGTILKIQTCRLQVQPINSSPGPLDSNTWFSGASVFFRPTPQPSQSHWPVSIQCPPSYDQVIKEKTQEEHKPTADPFQSNCTATQTDPVGEDATAIAVPQCSAALQTVTSTAGKKTQKPPRPSLSKSANKASAGETIVSTDGTVALNLSPSDIKESKGAESTVAAVRSVVVHWDSHTTAQSVRETVPSSSDSEHCHHPVPLPRTKFRKQVTGDGAKTHTLIKLCENSDSCYVPPATDPEKGLNKYLKELLEVFSADNCDKSDEPTQREDTIGKMNPNHSQRNIRARIQAFESQASVKEGEGVEHSKPEPQLRKSIIKPPVANKPSETLKPDVSQSTENIYEEVLPVDIPQNSAPAPPAPRPQAPKKPVALPIKDEPETVPTKDRSRPPMLLRSKTIQEEGATAAPPLPPLKKSLKEPLKPNLNINNHSLASVIRENEYVDNLSHHVALKPQHSVDSSGDSISKQCAPRRPTTIRVPSKSSTFSESFQDGAPPPLPAEKPVSYFNPFVDHRQSPVLVLPSAQSQNFQELPSRCVEPSLPPRPVGGKPLPPRPPPTKAGPGRPPPPHLDAAGRSQSALLPPREALPKPQSQMSQGKHVLPLRPKPGHILYNKYTLQLPHGIASFDYDGTDRGELSFQKNEVLLLLEEIDHNTFQCQAGEVQGRVHKSHMKVITPLSTVSDTSPPQGAGSGRAEGGMKVQAIYDFFPENADELGLKAGEVVTMVEQVDDQWYRGSCRGATGFFPINYVKVLFDSPKSVPERKAQPPPMTISGPRCVARFDFEGEHSDELSFSEGDVIQLLAYVGQEWARGQIGVCTGLFPLNFVEVIEDLPPPPSQQQTQPTRGAPPGPVPPPTVNTEAAKPAQFGADWVVALSDFAGKNEKDLSFQKGDIILVTHHINAEWSYGSLNGREGIFPRTFVESSTIETQQRPVTRVTTTVQQVSFFGGLFPMNFVEVTEDRLPPPRRQQTQPTRVALPGLVPRPTVNTEAAKPAQSGADWMVALYDFAGKNEKDLSFQKGDIILVTHHVNTEWSYGRLNGREGIFPRTFVESSTDQLSASQESGCGGQRGRALYDFQSNNDEELSLQAGDIITNLESMDTEWFMGDLRGKRALVPKTYVQVLQDT
ncbi:SH3 domain-containing protein 19, partial [Thalassophryne amazonica]|uniref:SH3 domain-containing protein 19 n=1 Tax=Thalassophryne amazonica TaxID=390379 RepID=UPI0014710B48